MSETLIIRNFGPIGNMSFEFKKINIFIGDQGTGKSTVAKVIVAIKNCIYREIFDLPKIDNLDKETQQFNEHLNLVGLNTFLKTDSFISYKCSDFEFGLIGSKVSINKNISIAESLRYNFNYIVAERSMVHVLADSLYALLEVKADLPKLFLRFGNKYQSSRKNKSEFNYSEMLGIKFMHKDNKDYILTPDGSKINLSDASSGIQGCVALLVVVDNIMSEFLHSGRSQYDLLKKNLRLLVIEEPELNCFPETQNKLLKYIIASNKILDMTPVFSESDDPENPNVDFIENYENELKNQSFITTHSPYILTSLNNLMYAYEVGKKEPVEANKIIDNKYWINPQEVSAYMLLKDGTCENIIQSDEDGTLIKADKIDEVSGLLNSEFDKLISLELINTL